MQRLIIVAGVLAALFVNLFIANGFATIGRWLWLNDQTTAAFLAFLVTIVALFLMLVSLWVGVKRFRNAKF